jgi:hypothetical protein
MTFAPLSFVLCTPLCAQETVGAFGFSTPDHVAGFAMQPRAVQFLAGTGEAALVKGAPYSGEAVTEFVQTLSDGTRITRKSISKMARDSEGRTRNENSGGPAGPIGFEIEPLVVINDPVAKTLFYLNERDKTAERVPVPTQRLDIVELRARAEQLQATARTAQGNAQAGQATAQAGQAAAQAVQIERGVVFQRAIPAQPAPPAPPGAAGSTGVNYAYATTTAINVMPGGQAAQRESLGKQVIAGVSCDATRITNSIPAGQIGNDREIRVVTETCVSPELKITLLSRTVDPMNGETTFRMSSLSRAEPAKSLFQVPAGYTVEEAPVMNTLPTLPAGPAIPATPGVRIRKQQ